MFNYLKLSRWGLPEKPLARGKHIDAQQKVGQCMSKNAVGNASGCNEERRPTECPPQEQLKNPDL